MALSILHTFIAALLLGITATFGIPTHPAHPAHATVHESKPYFKPEPGYAKWGKVAMDAVRSRYPGAKIADYKHIGRKKVDEDRAVENFKFWLRKDTQEWGVLVHIVFRESTDEVLGVESERVER